MAPCGVGVGEGAMLLLVLLLDDVLGVEEDVGGALLVDDCDVLVGVVDVLGVELLVGGNDEDVCGFDEVVGGGGGVDVVVGV